MPDAAAAEPAGPGAPDDVDPGPALGTITEDEQRLLEELRARFEFSEEYARAIIDLTREKLQDGGGNPPNAGA